MQNHSLAANPATTPRWLAVAQLRRVADWKRSVRPLPTIAVLSMAFLLGVNGCSARAHNIVGKGMELYSWYQGTDWHFSLVVGVNNRKPVLEVADVEQYGFIGVGQLKRKLSKLAKGQQVYWFNRGAEAVSGSMEKDLLKYCSSLEIKVEVEPAQNNALHADSAIPLEFQNRRSLAAEPVNAIVRGCCIRGFVGGAPAAQQR